MRNSLFPETSDEFMDVFTDEGCDESNIETNNMFLNNHLKKIPKNGFKLSNVEITEKKK